MTVFRRTTRSRSSRSCSSCRTSFNRVTPSNGWELPSPRLPPLAGLPAAHTLWRVYCSVGVGLSGLGLQELRLGLQRGHQLLGSSVLRIFGRWWKIRQIVLSREKKNKKKNCSKLLPGERVTGGLSTAGGGNGKRANGSRRLQSWLSTDRF